jgi:hypothetical protein
LSPALENQIINHRHAQTMTYPTAAREPKTVVDPKTASGSTTNRPTQTAGCIVTMNATVRCGSRRMP